MSSYSKHFSCENSLLPAKKVIVLVVKTKENHTVLAGRVI